MAKRRRKREDHYVALVAVSSISNDGTLLASYAVPGLFKIGFDPAQNLGSLYS
jgi:hypothetical protein